MAEFKINHIFSLSGRGEVLAGDILKGEISRGDLITIPGDSDVISVKIQSVEFLDHIVFKKVQIGLMLGNIDKNVCRKLELMVGRTVKTDEK